MSKNRKILSLVAGDGIAFQFLSGHKVIIGNSSSGFFEKVEPQGGDAYIQTSFPLVTGGLTAKGFVKMIPEGETTTVLDAVTVLHLQNVGTSANPDYAVRIPRNLRVDGDVVAYGTPSGTPTPTAYDRLDPATSGAAPEAHVWPTYDSAKAGWILSAALGWNLDARLSIVEGHHDALGDLSNVSTAGATNGQALVFNGTSWAPATISGGGSGGGGTLSSVALSMPTGFKVTGSPLTQDGTLSVAFDSENGYGAIPTLQQMKLFSALSVTEANDAITGVTCGHPLAVTGNITATGDIVAYGTPAGGTTPTAYSRLDPATMGVDAASHTWPTYDSSKLGYILSAALGWNLDARVTDLDTRVTTLEQSGGGGGGETGHTHSNMAVLNSLTAEKVASWDAIVPLFTIVKTNDVVTGITANYPVSVTGALAATGNISAGGNISATGDIVAYGTASGQQTPTAYNRLDPVSDAWPTYDSTKLGWVLSAALGWDLETRVAVLEQSGGGGSSHTHSNLTLLESITAERVAAWDNGGGGGGETGHTHANLSTLNNITDTKFNNWDAAYAAMHSHSNKSVLDGITSTLVSHWNSAYNEIGFADYNSSAKALATQEWVNGRGYLTSHQSLSGYATETWVTNRGYITSSALNGYATQQWVNNQGFLTSHQSLSGYATETWVTNKGYLTSVPAASDSAYGGFKTGYSGSGKNYAVQLNSSGKAFVNVPWENTEYTHPTGGANKTISAADGKVLSAITVNSLGHVTDVSSKSLAAADIPDLGSTYLKLTGGTLSGALAGTTLAMRSATFGDASNQGSVSIVRKIGSTTYTAQVSIDSSGNVVITPTSTGIIKCSGTVRATGDVIAYQ